MAEKKLLTYWVPMNVTLRGYGQVEAADAGDAAEKAKSGWAHFDRERAGMTDWEVVGKPELDE